MKRLLLLSATCFLTISSIFAQHRTAELNLKLFNNREFYFILDGINYPSGYNQHIENLSAGNHFLTVYTNEWRHRRFENHIIFRGNVFVEPFTKTYASVGFGSLQIDRVIDCHPDHDYGYGHEYAQQPYNYGSGHCNNQYNSCAPHAMSDQEFLSFMHIMHDASFESTKLSIAKTALYNNYFTTCQVKQILNQFSFESTKLDFAKSAYAQTIDKNNFYSVADVFAFDSSTMDLNNFILSR